MYAIKIITNDQWNGCLVMKDGSFATRTFATEKEAEDYANQFDYKYEIVDMRDYIGWSGSDEM